MEYQCALLNFVVYFVLVFEAAALKLTVDSEPQIVYKGCLYKDGGLKLLCVTDDGKLKELDTDCLSLLRQHAGKPIHLDDLVYRLISVNDDFVATYERRPVQFQPKSSDQIFYGTYFPEGGLQIDRVEDKAGIHVEKDSKNIAAELNKLQSRVIFTIENEVYVLDTAILHKLYQPDIESDKNVLVEIGEVVLVEFSRNSVRVYLASNSDFFYSGLEIQPGVIEVTQFEDPEGKLGGMTIQDAGKFLMENKPNLIYVTVDRFSKNFDSVTDVGDKSFTVKCSDIDAKFTVGALDKSIYSGIVFQEGILKILKKDNIPISKNIAQVIEKLKIAKKSETKIFLDEEEYVKKITNVRGKGESVIVSFSYFDINFSVDSQPTIQFCGRFDRPGFIDVTAVYVDASTGDLKDYHKTLVDCQGKTVVVGEQGDKLTIIEVGQLVHGICSVRYSEPNTT